ncbi:class I SAM-dependent methyltransferase [Motiliproteus sp. SC1-56]|uniref:class I SAM-dependent methyltransferase n=1 Tax=Motiliproteus sp. SC1-56 TaxID=2799565 RepID=UPI001A8ECFCF|nr:class I SAM-dependent methyltransferase [Motiliproteus sp. SC1-56]
MIDPLIEALERGLSDPDTDARRLFHGRGRCYPGLEQVTVDLLGPVLLVTLFREPESDLLTPIEALARGHDRVEGLLVQHRYRAGAPNECRYGTVPETLVVTEQGLRYEVRLDRHQNSGLFLDMAEGRRWLRTHAEGCNVLNLFAYTCGFSVAALAGGAEAVVNLDMSRGALNRGRENHRLNEHELRRVRFLPHDLFRSWGRLKKLGPYQRVIVDPPSFQRGSFVAGKDYVRVLRRLPEVLADEAQVLLCLNDPAFGPEFLIEAMAEACPRAVFAERLPTPAVFAEQDPARGLKVLRFTYSASSQ